MDPQVLEAILRALSGQTSSGLPSQNSRSQGNPGSFDFNPLQSFSPVNANQNYANTISQHFANNPVAGARPFSFRPPLAPGLAGNHAARASNGYWSSIGPENPGSTMQSILSALQQ